MSGNTYRGTPNRNQGRGGIPFTGSPGGSNIPRPVIETTHAPSPSDAGGSTLSASRQKQTKRDEVRCLFVFTPTILYQFFTFFFSFFLKFFFFCSFPSSPSFYLGQSFLHYYPLAQ